MRVLVTGGAGYIGSHTIVQLVAKGHQVAILDDFSNSSPVAVERIRTITGQDIPLFTGDLRDAAVADDALATFRPDSVIHCAGLKAVGESVAAQPIRYYDVNLGSTISLLESMQRHGVTDIVFSSSATVYGSADIMPLNEDTPVGIGITNPYGRSKFIIEEMLRDAVIADPALRVTVLRYFNPIGAHPSGLIGEAPNGIPNNLAPYISQVAVGVRPEVAVFGNAYPTRDGTGERDYVHVMDLADGHVAAVEKAKPGFVAINLGTGRGTTVLELIAAFSRAVGREIPYRIAPPRPGDQAVSYADPGLAKVVLGWSATRSVDEASADSWRWQSGNPSGYSESKP